MKAGMAQHSELQRLNKRLYRSYLLKEGLRGLYDRLDPAEAERHLKRWLAWASRSKLGPFVKLARTIRSHREGVLDAVRIGLSNGRVRGARREGPADQQPLVRVPLSRTLDRDGLPVLRRGRDRAAGAMSSPTRQESLK